MNTEYYNKFATNFYKMCWMKENHPELVDSRYGRF